MMNKLLAKASRPAATATGRDQAGHARTPRIRTAGTSARRLKLALAMMPVVTALSLLGSGVASASDWAEMGGNGPTIVSGGVASFGSWSADVSCDAARHTITFTAGIVPAWDNEQVYVQEWLYSYQTQQWYAGRQFTAAPYQRPGLQLTLGPTSEPAGWYYIHFVYGWLTPAGWQTTMVAVNRYQQYGTTVGVNGTPSTGCRA